MKEIKKNKNIVVKSEGILVQLFVITMMFSLFFFTARISSLFSTYSSEIKTIINIMLIISVCLCILLGAAWIYRCVVTKKTLYNRRKFIIYGLMFTIHYLIRVTLVGSQQLDEGLNSYNSLKYLSFHPDILLDNFIEGNMLADRMAIGYNFFALMGEFMSPGTGVGFQWAQLIMGSIAACCLYGIFEKMFMKAKTSIVWGAAFIVSVQPMFLGLSTTCSLEYGITVFFIYALYCYLNRKYILMVFWLAALGTTKGTGAIMALSFIGAALVIQVWMQKKQIVPSYFKAKTNAMENERDIEEDDDSESGIDFKTSFITMVSIAAVVTLVYVVIRICMANGVELSWHYIFTKLAQLYVLNFSWVWLIIIIAGVVMVSANIRVRKTHKMDIAPLFIILVCYSVYAMYLLAYTKAMLPRYNMLADVIFVMLGVCALIKMFERKRAIIPVYLILSLFMIVEAYITVDPVTLDMFTHVGDAEYPVVYTASFRRDVQRIYDIPGDYAYYNYQYTYDQSAEVNNEGEK